MITDADLLARARHLDSDALTQLFDLHNAGVYRYAMRLVGDARLAEDCVTEAFGRLLAALRAGGGPDDDVRAYLLRTAHNWLMDEHRKHRRSAPTVPLGDAEAQRVANDDDDPLQQASHRIRRERLRAALARLTPDQQQVLALRFLEGYSIDEAARLMEKPAGAIKALQFRAVAALKRLLAGELLFDDMDAS